MDIPPEVLAAKDELAPTLFATGMVTGIDFGVRNEEQPDPEDVVLRIFVRDELQIPPEVLAASQLFPWPVVIIQRVFTITQFPDNQRYRPVAGGVSIAASRFVPTGAIHAGTLGAIVTDALDPSILLGLSNYHVMCVDMGRQVGDEIVQPVPSLLGPLPGDRIGTLKDWSFPETVQEGVVDAAVCALEEAALQSVVDIGQVSGTIPPTLGMQVTKRGRATGQTFGYISGTDGDYPIDFPNLPAVTLPDGSTTITRIMKHQLQIHADFPLTLIFGDSGDSGSVVVSGTQVVGLYWGSGSKTLGDPLVFGLANRATQVEMALGITF